MNDRRSPPTGTITFLFTDIEGSTRLIESLGDRWPAVLERHREILRACLAAGDGLEIQTEGDGLFGVFPSATASIIAVSAAQRELQAEPWPADAPIKVRMGLHTGEGSLDHEGSYVGHDVHRASRISAAGHGGQVLLSETTRALVASALPDGVSLRDLGEHRLRDLRPEALYELVIDGLPGDFPPIRSLDVQPNNLPVQLTSFVGRDRDLEVVADLLRQTRLLTLTGPGGTGKTRLALQLAALAADEHPDGVWFVALEPLRDPALVLPTIAHTLGIIPRPGKAAIDALVGSLAGKRQLLILDNFEQVIEAAGDVASLLRVCDLTRIVVTSRATLRVAGEHEYMLGGLPTPPDTSRLSRVELEELPSTLRHPDAATVDHYEAVRLFIARALAVRSDFAVTNDNAPAVAGITARLQGMPLAIELAAARAKLLSPEAILARLEQQLGILTSSARDLSDRQRTLRGAIAWSADLLDDAQRRLLGWLSVFRGGWGLETIEAVMEQLPDLGFDVLDGLGDLVDQSLVRRDDEAGPAVRFSMLESIREFAAEILEESGEGRDVAAAHAATYLALAEEAAPHLQGAEQRDWVDRLERDHDNLRKAITWATDLPDPAVAMRMAFALWRFWQQRGYLDEAWVMLESMAAKDWDVEPALRARFAEAAGGVAYWRGDAPAAQRWYEVALGLAREQAADGDAERRGALANALYNRAYASLAESMMDSDSGTPPDPASRAMMEEALAIYEELGDVVGEGNLLWGLGSYSMFSGETPDAVRHFERSRELHHAAGHSTMEAWSRHMLAMALLMSGHHTEAAKLATSALRHFSEAGDISGITLALDVLSVVALATGERRRGGRLWGAARQLQRVSGAGIADWDRKLVSLLPYNVEGAFTPEQLEATAAEGAALSLSDAVAYALREREPFADA